MAEIKDEDIIVELEEAPKEPEIEVVRADSPEPKPKPKEISPDAGLEALKSQLALERSQRIEAEKAANEARSNAHRAQSEVQDTNLSLVTNAIETVKQSNDILKANLSAAYASGDYDRVAEIQLDMSANSAKLLQLESGKQALSAQPKPQAPEPYHNSDPVEALARSLSAPSADWVRRHPEYARNQRLLQQMIAADGLAQARGYIADSPDYFADVEKTLGLSLPGEEPIDDSALSEASKPTQRRSAPPAAPVTRSGEATSTGKNRVRLTSEQIEMAEAMGQTPAEYARELLKIRQESRLN